MTLWKKKKKKCDEILTTEKKPKNVKSEKNTSRLRQSDNDAFILYLLLDSHFSSWLMYKQNCSVFSVKMLFNAHFRFCLAKGEHFRLNYYYYHYIR